MKNYVNISEEELTRIDNYLNDNLSDAKREAFQKEMDLNDVLKLQVQEIDSLRLAVERSAIKERMNDYHKVFDKSPEKREVSKVFSLPWYQLLAAAIFVVAAGSYWLLGSSDERLFDAYFTPDPGLATPMSTNNNYEFYRGMVSYKQGDYEYAVGQWLELLENRPKNDTLNYFIGVAYMADNKEFKAIDYLIQVADNEAFVFKNEAAFYLALAYLKSEDKAEAVEWLQKSEKKKASELLNELKID